ncbi:cyclic lactone autoinducer peptide [Priestia flexa]|jgi:cyclic lactone autoinducer peptide|uniref:Cyclic lactone autoinducer peptide n=1 Tax=Priestia flexa TaxID=86664 RepID=A0A8I1MHL7_9BACI|nr:MULTISPECIES: cyclic lactone autoinducer peptide [Bacillaceae]MBY6023567.1 cyclic lactone autoinducer peptide [Nitratireductor sp. DP7N14-4]USY55577.1 cyclic lactone autoinducer peptide [Bacillus sp. 1780r2a1]MBN8252864.1 cyclic lactone autoinducer peptide [Priestia flexa]MBN8435286.1 cyclic lactone autoinducer peptide [Priestia flexa]MCA0967800.1 cyclic lactone autoinducer peptide [Priestia flexa]
MKKYLYNFVAATGLFMTQATFTTSCFLGLYEPELPEDEDEELQ